MPGYIALNGEGVVRRQAHHGLPGQPRHRVRLASGRRADLRQRARQPRRGARRHARSPASAPPPSPASPRARSRAKTRRTLAILGAGVQAHAHLEAMCAVRPIRTLRVWSRNAGERAQARRRRARELSVSTRPRRHDRRRRRARRRHRLHDDVVATSRCCSANGLSPGTHINAVGVSQPTRARARLGRPWFGRDSTSIDASRRSRSRATFSCRCRRARSRPTTSSARSARC